MPRLLAIFLLAASAASARPATTHSVSVIVQGRSLASTLIALGAVGAKIDSTLPIIDGAAARVPADAIAGLERRPDIVAVTSNAPVRLYGESTSGNTSTINSVFARAVNADRLWSAGVNGAGIRVALIDTGVSAVPDLTGRIARVPDPNTKPPTDGSEHPTVECVNLSGDDDCDDDYGHGTFMAGLIAGTGAMSNGTWKGVAPGAQIVSVKIAGRDGSADVSKVLAAIQWVVSFAEDLNIRVLNLSLGTDSTRSYKDDPLNFAVERAWRKGLVVVVAASNRGPGLSTVSKPGDDPFVVTVGAVDDRESPGASDDRLPMFSARGPTAADGLAKPDVVAPGGRVVSLRAPGSHIGTKVRGIDQWYLRGSGTSMATAVVSGAAALVLDANDGWHPSAAGRGGDWVPNRVKYALTSTARKVAERDERAIGRGLIDAYAAAYNAPPGLANQGVEYGDAKRDDGSYAPLDGGTPYDPSYADSSRGSVYVTNERQCSQLEQTLDDLGQHGKCAVYLYGANMANGGTFNAEVYAESKWTGSSWYGSSWYGSSWYGSSWYGRWYGSSWYGRWYGSSWYGSSWYGSTDETSYGTAVEGSSWYGAWE